MSKKVFIKTFGCQMNEYDSDKMADVLGAAQGYEPTDDVEQADLILFNTLWYDCFIQLQGDVKRKIARGTFEIE